MQARGEKSRGLQIEEGTDVLAADGQKVGEVDRVVLDPISKEVTHLVIEKGFLLKTEKVIPISVVGPATDETVTSWQQSDEIDAFPDLVEEEYVAATRKDDLEMRERVPAGPARPLYPYPPFVLPGEVSGRGMFRVPDYVMHVEQNIPDGTVALEAGAHVVSSDGDTLGDIERILVDPETEYATHLVISEGFLEKTRKLVPTSWIGRLGEDTVELTLEADVIHELPEYVEEQEKETNNA
jgi:uncharacterized protein YrrD